MELDRVDDACVGVPCCAVVPARNPVLALCDGHLLGCQVVGISCSELEGKLCRRGFPGQIVDHLLGTVTVNLVGVAIQA